MKHDDTVAKNLRHTLFTWSAQGGLDPIEIVSADGSHFTDAKGRRILDLASFALNASAALRHPKIAEAIARQSEILPAAGPKMATAIRGRYGASLAQVTPPGLDTFLFTLGGADANEHAIKIARLVTGRAKIVTRYRSYHGATLARSRRRATRAGFRSSRGFRASSGCSTPIATAAPSAGRPRSASDRASITSTR